MHFNGQRWSAVTIPVLPQGTASLAPDNIWAVGPLASAAGQPIPQPYALPFQTAGLGPLSHDGQGRLWIRTIPPPATGEPLTMAHYNSAGQWSVTPVTLPGGTEGTATGMRLIPGTSSVWASAIILSDRDGSTLGGMLKYGP